MRFDLEPFQSRIGIHNAYDLRMTTDELPIGRVDQLEDRYLGMVEAPSSNLGTSTPIDLNLPLPCYIGCLLYTSDAADE